MKFREFFRMVGLLLLWSIGITALALGLWLGIVLSLTWILEQID